MERNSAECGSRTPGTQCLLHCSPEVCRWHQTIVRPRQERARARCTCSVRHHESRARRLRLFCRHTCVPSWPSLWTLPRYRVAWDPVYRKRHVCRYGWWPRLLLAFRITCLLRNQQPATRGWCLPGQTKPGPSVWDHWDSYPKDRPTCLPHRATNTWGLPCGLHSSQFWLQDPAPPFPASHEEGWYQSRS